MNTRGRKRQPTTNIDEQETPLDKSKKQKTMVNIKEEIGSKETDSRIRLLIQELDRLGHADTARHLEQQSVWSCVL
jgi:hypothetical protein